MASLRDREVAVSDKNDSRQGPSGRRARSADSFYLEVGGSRDSYNVTINFVGKSGHWCEKFDGARCHGNGNGKSRSYGPPPSRDKRDPVQWCKHVQAALANTEALAEAQERTARAFDRRVAINEPVAPKAVEAKPAAVVVDAKARLAALEAEADKLRASVEIGEKIAALVNEYGFEAVAEAFKAA